MESNAFGYKPQIKLIEKKETRTSRGMLSKAWYMIDGKLCMVKANSQDGNGNIGYEPYSEVMAYKIATLLGLDAVPYWLMDAKLFPEITVYGVDHVSVCENMLREDEKLFPLESYLFVVLGGSEPEDYIKLVEENLDITYLYNLLAFDAFVGNQDRHTLNIGVIRDADYKYRFSPIYDTGASLLAWTPDKELTLASQIGRIDKAKPLRSTHSKQIKLIDQILFPDLNLETFLDEVVNNISSELNLLPSRRSKAIVSYLSWRLKYLRKVTVDETNV